MAETLEHGGLGPGKGWPFIVPLMLGMFAFSAVFLLLIDPPGVLEWLMTMIVGAVCLPVAAFVLAGRHVAITPAAGSVVLTRSFGPLRWRRVFDLRQARGVIVRFRPVTTRAISLRSERTVESRETFVTLLEFDPPLVVHRFAEWRNPDDNRREAEAAARAIAAATGLPARREGYVVEEGPPRVISQAKGATAPL